MSLNSRRPFFHQFFLYCFLLSALLLGGVAGLTAPNAAPAMTSTVNSLADTDDGFCDTAPDCTLREAINAANVNPGADTIDALGVTGTINLTGALPDISDEVTINGPGANLLTVRRDTGGDYRIFKIIGDFNVAIDGLTISNGNASLDFPDEGGGGIRKEGTGTLTVTNSTVKDNSTTSGGGGIFNLGGTVNVTNSTLSGNSAFQGGGIFSSGGALTVTNSTLNNNSAVGGGIFSVAVTLTVTKSTLNNNNSPFGNAGGILSVGGGTVDIINSTLSGNSAAVGGGGIFCVNPLTITNSTVTSNHVDFGTGGGIRQVSGFVLTLRNTIVAGNFKGSSPGTTANDIDGSVDVSSSYNLIGTGGSGGLTDGTNNNQVGVISPGLGPLQNNGGPTQTHALLPTSSAIDKGNSFGSVTDQRGSPRPVDLDDATYPNAGDASDIGAYEIANLDTDADGDGVPDSADACPGTPTGTPVNASGCPQGVCFAPPSGMLSWWPGDGNADDIMDGNPGTISGGMTFVSGKVGQAFNFDGSNFVGIPSNASLLPPEQITVDGWIKPVFSGRPFQVADADIIIEKFDNLARGYVLSVAMDPTSSLFFQAPPGGVPLGTPAFFLNVGGIPNQIFGPTPIPNDGNFHFVAGTYDGTMMRLFLDGIEVASRPVTGSIEHAGSADVSIGRENVFSRNSKAAIDEVELFNRALSQIEIAAIYNAGSAGKCKFSDECPNDPNKTAPGVCGCGVPDTDSDNDSTPDCLDQCPLDPAKTAPGVCGCGRPDTDTDGDGVPDCIDNCPGDPAKTSPGACGCGVADTDSDHDGTPDCHDSCPSDPNKTAPGACGCGAPDIDTDHDGIADCTDACPLDPGNDADSDGVCGNVDNCPLVANPDQHDIDNDGIGDACDPPTEACFVVDFREITYFKNTQVITSSDAGIRTVNHLTGGFNPALWPYDQQGGNNKTKSRGTLFRIYGFQASQVGAVIHDADTASTYIVTADPQISGVFYIQLNGPARVIICPSQLQTHFIADNEQLKAWTLPGTGELTDQQKNVAGIMLNHNVARIAVPNRVRDELAALGMPLLNANGHEAQNGLVDYIGFQLWGHGNADYREFVNVDVRFIYDDAHDRLKHYLFGFHTAKNGDLESFAGCNYLDRAPGNDGVRFNDVWAGRNQNNPQWGPACGALEPLQNQKVRENYAEPFNGMQILPTVNTNDDTLRIFFGRIRAPN